MIIHGTLLLPDGPRSVRLARGWLRIDGGRIAELHEGDPPAACDLGGEAALIAPGFIDTHLHLPQYRIIGAYGMDLMAWLGRVTFPAEARWADIDHAAQETERVLGELLSVGTTSFAAYATVHHEPVKLALAMCAERGLRAVVGQVLMDREAPPDVLRDTDTQLAETAELLAQWPADPVTGRVSAAVTPRFAVTSSAELLRGAGELAQRHHAYVQTHLAEMLAELDAVRRLHEAEHYTGVYADAGLLSPRTILGHCIHLSDHERRLLSASRSVAAHCPTANTFLKSGAMDRAKHHGAGVRVSLGSDIGGGHERSMLRVARAMIETAHHVAGPVISTGEAWWQITAGNADAMGWPRTGRLAPDGEADLLVIQPDVPWLEAPDPLGMVLFAWDDRWLKATVVNGRVAWTAA